MEKKSSNMTIAAAVVVASLLWILVIAGLYGSKLNLEDIPGSIIKKGEILSRIRINLLKSLELEKSAVMAITDEESKDFAGQSLKAAEDVDHDLKELNSLIEASGIDEEKKLLGEFHDCWKECKKIDEMLLEFAVQNTNLKAASLSYTKGAESIKLFEQALTNAAEINSSAAENSQIVILVCHAVIDVLKLYNLHAPHIDAVSDEQMDQIESVMKAEEEKVNTSLNTLLSIADRQCLVYVNDAVAAFTEFMQVNAEVVRLSRLNSNIKSLELSLGRKHKAAVQCQEILSLMQETIQNRTFKATR